MIHPAKEMPFEDLVKILNEAVEQGLVTAKEGLDDLVIYTYTQKAVYDDIWTPATLMSRGLILDHKNKKVVATPFPKFFNVGEKSSLVPNLPFKAFEKIDGSLVIIFYHNYQWKTATKGSFTSEQALWAQKQLTREIQNKLVPGNTYLVEAVYPENQIVIKYDEDAMFLLGIYDEYGHELHHEVVEKIGKDLGWKTPEQYIGESLAELIDKATKLPGNHEGFVVKFSNGYRVKIKGDEYLKLHRCISNVTPLAIWELMLEEKDLEEFKKNLPEEYHQDFDKIVCLLQKKMDFLVADIEAAGDVSKDWTDKEVGLNMDKLHPSVRPFIFAYRKNLLNSKYRKKLYDTIRPTGNRLDGYAPSKSINRLLDEL